METAVEILFNELNEIRVESECGNIDAIDFFRLQKRAKAKALKMEKQQMCDAFYAPIDINTPKNFITYYNKLFNNKQR